MPHSIISSIGLANPPFKVPQSDIFEFMSMAHGLNPIEKSRLKKIYDGSGIDFRYSVLEDFSKTPGHFTFFGNGEELDPFPGTKKRMQVFKEHSLSLAIQAVHHCLSPLPDFDIQSITHIITVTCTGLHAPGLDIELVSKLNLHPETERTCINFMGCYAGFNALKTADYISRSNPNHKILIISVELCTLHFQRENHLQNWLSNALFGDGAAAVLVESNHFSSQNNGALRLSGFYSTLMLAAKKEMSWNIGDFGFEMQLSSHITKSIKSNIHSVASKLLQKSKSGLTEISHYAIHPGGRRILEVCEEELGFSGGKNHPSYSVLRDFGNMSSSTIFFVLNELLSRIQGGSLEKGPVMAFAFGPGLTIESMILEPLP